MAIIQSRIKCKSDLNTMKTQIHHARDLREKSVLSSKIKSCRITYALWQPGRTEKIFGIWEKMQEMSQMSFANPASSSRACTTQTRSCIATSGKLFIEGNLSVAVIIEYAMSLKRNETFIKLDNGTQVSTMLEVVLCAIKKTQQREQGISR